MVIKINTIPFSPNLECRYFADLMLLKFWGCDIDKKDLLGLSGGFSFVYSWVNFNKKSFFSIFGRRPKLLQRITLVLNGEYFENYSGEIEDLHYLTEHMNIPVLAKVDFKMFKNYYSMPIKNLISINIEKLSKYNIINDFPHEVIVIGCKDNYVICFDNLSMKALKIPAEDFLSMWKISHFEFNSRKKCYFEYISLPSNSISQKIFPDLIFFSLQLVINSFFTVYTQRDKVHTKFFIGQQALHQFKNDLQEEKFNQDNYNFSMEMISELDKHFWKGLERKVFADFIDEIFKKYRKYFQHKSNLIHKLVEFYNNLSIEWIKFFNTSKTFDKEFILSKINEIEKKEINAVFMLSEIIS